MYFIGITGGVGTGKSEIIRYLEHKADTRVLLADEIAHELMEPGGACYEELRALFSDEDIFLPEGGFDRGRLAAVIFADDGKRERLNAIVHPAVKEYVRAQAALERERGALAWLFLEAALLIEEHYDEICDELWYIYTREEIRQQRLMEGRGYSPEKVRQIFASQSGEEVYRAACRVVIDNNGTVEEAFAQIDRAISNMNRRTGDTADE